MKGNENFTVLVILAGCYQGFRAGPSS